MINVGWNVTKSHLMVLIQHLLNAINSPTFDDSDPIHIIKEYARWCKWTRPVGSDIPLWNWELATIWYNMLECRAGSRHCTIFDSWDIGRIQGKVGSLEKAANSYHNGQDDCLMYLQKYTPPVAKSCMKGFSQKNPILGGIDVDIMGELLTLIQNTAFRNDKVDILV